MRITIPAFVGEVWYRYEDRLYSSGVDEWERSLGPANVKVALIQIPVIRHTPKGVWLRTWKGDRFVLKTANKHYACSTVEEAVISFVARKERQIQIYSARLRHAKDALRLVDKQKVELV